MTAATRNPSRSGQSAGRLSGPPWLSIFLRVQYPWPDTHCAEQRWVSGRQGSACFRVMGRVPPACPPALPSFLSRRTNEGHGGPRSIAKPHHRKRVPAGAIMPMGTAPSPRGIRPIAPLGWAVCRHRVRNRCSGRIVALCPTPRHGPRNCIVRVALAPGRYPSNSICFAVRAAFRTISVPGVAAIAAFNSTSGPRAVSSASRRMRRPRKLAVLCRATASTMSISLWRPARSRMLSGGSSCAGPSCALDVRRQARMMSQRMREKQVR